MVFINAQLIGPLRAVEGVSGNLHFPVNQANTLGKATDGAKQVKRYLPIVKSLIYITEYDCGIRITDCPEVSRQLDCRGEQTVQPIGGR